MTEILTIENLIALFTLTSLEVILGFDNIVVLTLLVSKLEKKRQDFARKLGMFCAVVMRVMLLFSISWLMKLNNPFFSLLGHEVTARDLVFLLGGLFLIGKATFEIHESTEGHGEGLKKEVKNIHGFTAVISQIVLIDLVFSIDSVITAVGMSSQIEVMVLAVLISAVLMMYSAKMIGDFIEKHPTFKVLALSFLVLVGVMLFAEGLGQHIEKGYIYFAMGFSLSVEFINLRIRAAKA